MFIEHSPMKTGLQNSGEKNYDLFITSKISIMHQVL